MLSEELRHPRAGLERSAAMRHHELEAACVDLARLAQGDQPRWLAVRWHALDTALREHMDAEERWIIPAYKITAPEEGVELRHEHARLRERLDRVSADIARGAPCNERLVELAAAFHAHGVREDASMYPWAERNVSRLVRRQMYVRVRHWLRRFGEHRSRARTSR
jgi:hypothetical protein